MGMEIDGVEDFQNFSQWIKNIAGLFNNYNPNISQ